LRLIVSPFDFIGFVTAAAAAQHLDLLKDWRPISADACLQPESLEAESDVSAIEGVLGWVAHCILGPPSSEMCSR
jgi:hypothetical protein